MYIIKYKKEIHKNAFIIPSTGEHITNGLPDIPNGQVQIGIWFATLQRASRPHVPVHGFLHLLLIQALSLGQSKFKTHSGRHPK